MTLYLGIDLGTSNSAVVGNEDGQLRLYKTADGTDVLPSAIYIDRRGHRLYGKRAYDQTVLAPENVAQGFKRLMGTSTPFPFDAAKISMTPEECSAEILRQLMGQVGTESSGAAVEGAVVTIPAAFNQMQSEATIRAARLAGLDQVGLLQEPVAAAMAAMTSVKTKSGVFMVYDLGGGTFDLALVQSTSGTVSILAHEGINMLGGRDFDTMIVNQLVRPWLLETFDLPDNFQADPRWKRLTGIARLKAEQAKIGLSATEQEVIFAAEEEIRAQDGSGTPIFLELPLHRRDLETLIRPRIAETVHLSRKLLAANSFKPEDIDRIVMIGGPSKMPLVREIVGHELGIVVDIGVDPMTAVAAGAAIFAESRDWFAGETRRKSARGSVSGGGALRLQAEFPARATEDRARVRIRPQAVGADGATVEIVAEDGWTSGRQRVDGPITFELPLPTMGEHRFTLCAFASDGRPLPEAGSRFAITRTHATAAGIPATQTVAVKLVEEVGGSGRNVLFPLVAKGTTLPAQGTAAFRAARDLRAGGEGHIDLELYQQAENVPEPELNLFIGSFRIAAADLPEGTRIRRGDEIRCHWTMDDNGLLRCGLELPTVGQRFDSERFYVDALGHRSFNGAEGRALAEEMVKFAEAELENTADAVDQFASADLTMLRERLSRQRRALDAASDADSQRSITEEARHLRQELSRLRHAPEHRAAVIAERTRSFKQSYRSLLGGDLDPRVDARFHQIITSAEHYLSIGDKDALDEADRLMDEAEAIRFRELLDRPEFLVALFQKCAEERHLVVDRAEFARHVQRGQRAIAKEDWDELRGVIFGIMRNRVVVGTPEQALGILASLMRA
jgi:molecular chaperone DnaK